jgi:HAD superfamily hydrolase (TIGR01509 family)
VIKAIIFDCFGVIKRDGLIEAYEKMGGDPVEDKEFIESTIFAVNKGQIPTSVPIFAEKLNVSDDEWWEAIQSANTVDYKVLAYAKELRKKYKTAMLSNISSNGLKRIFDPGFLEDYFDVTVASGDIGFAKPEARAYETVADLLSVRLEECVMIDDRQDYCDGATAVGMHAILYISLDQLKRELDKILK